MSSSSQGSSQINGKKKYDRILTLIGDIGCKKCEEFKPLWDLLTSEEFVKNNFLTLKFIGCGNMEPYATHKIIYQEKKKRSGKFEDMVDEEKLNKLIYKDKYETMKKEGKLPIRERVKRQKIPAAFVSSEDERINIPCIFIVSTIEYSKRWDIETGEPRELYKKKIENMKQYNGKLKDIKDGKFIIHPELISWIKANIDSEFDPIE